MNEEKKNGLEMPKNRDELLKSEIGEFGWFQMRFILLAALPVLFSGIKSDYMLSAAAIPHR